MTDTLTLLARRRARGFSSLEQQWELALQRLRSTGLGIDQMRKIAESCTGPTMASRLARVIGVAGSDSYSLLTRAVDDSPRTLTEWLGALDVFYCWLDKKGRHAPLGNALGYIHCCTQTDSIRSLTDIVEDMLQYYGFEAVAEA